MRKIVFKSGKELEIDGITQSGKSLQISIKSSDVKSIIGTFSDPENTAVMRYYVGTDLMCGYAGFKKFAGLEYTPDVIASINYEQEDATTESGFAESHVAVCTVHMEKVETVELPEGMTDKVAKLENDVSSIASASMQSTEFWRANNMFTEKAKENLKAMLWQAKISAVDNTDAQAMRVPSLYADWEALESGTHLTKGQRVNYKGVLYNVLTDHDKQAQWTPEAAPSLFAKVLIPDSVVIPDWEQPLSTNGYKKGDRVRHKSKIWESLVDNNVWEPGVMGTEGQWKEVTE